MSTAPAAATAISLTYPSHTQRNHFQPRFIPGSDPLTPAPGRLVHPLRRRSEGRSVSRQAAQLAQEAPPFCRRRSTQSPHHLGAEPSLRRLPVPGHASSKSPTSPFSAPSSAFHPHTCPTNSRAVPTPPHSTPLVSRRPGSFTMAAHGPQLEAAPRPIPCAHARHGPPSPPAHLATAASSSLASPSPANKDRSARPEAVGMCTIELRPITTNGTRNQPF